MSNVTNSAVLVINQALEPVSICALRRALTLLVKDSATVQEGFEYDIYPGIPRPRVIRLKRYRYIPIRVQTLSRKNILLRDRHRCSYCDKPFHPSVLTLDHVIPKSKGGRDTWDNLVACCDFCNKKKGDKSLEESGMTLLRKPRPATVHTSRHILRNLGAEDPAWRKYLYFDSSEDRQYVTRG